MPHFARAVLDSSRGLTATAPFSRATDTSSGTTNDSSPFVPFIFTIWPSTLAVTPDGTATGFLPTRDIFESPWFCADASALEDLAEHFAAHVLLPGLVIGHHALRRRENGDAEAVSHARHGVDGSIHAAARLGDALDGADHRLAVIVLQLDRKLSPAIAELRLRVVADVALGLEDFENASAQLRARGGNSTATAHLRVADTGEHIAQRIVDHMMPSLTSWTSRGLGSGPCCRARAERCGTCRACGSKRGDGP